MKKAVLPVVSHIGCLQSRRPEGPQAQPTSATEKSLGVLPGRGLRAQQGRAALPSADPFPHGRRSIVYHADVDTMRD